MSIGIPCVIFLNSHKYKKSFGYITSTTAQWQITTLVYDRKSTLLSGVLCFALTKEIFTLYHELIRRFDVFVVFLIGYKEKLHLYLSL